MTDFAASARAKAQALAERAGKAMSGLPGRLLTLTVIVVLVAEIVVFGPALGGFHKTWLMERINLAQTAALALEAAPGERIAAPLQVELLESAEVKRIAFKRDGSRVLLLEEPFANSSGLRLATYDYTLNNPIFELGYAIETLFAPKGRVIRVLAKPRFDNGEFVEIVLNEAPLKLAMGRYALRTLFISTLISLLVGALVYYVLSFAFVRPMRKLTASIERFRDRPEDASIPFERSSRADEIGRAERAAAEMAEQIRANLRQRERLALLGGAVSRIAHDLRNMLATAQIVSERLAASDDPKVRQIAPRLERAIGRAAGLASSTARFGKVDEEAPVLRAVHLDAAVEEAVADALIAFPGVHTRIDVEPHLVAIADEEHTHRIIVNLLRNAAQALGGREDACITLRAMRHNGCCVIDVIDNGPGVPARVEGRLFEPFASSDGHGAGLGLTITRELARALGGDVELARNGAEGACFRVTLPAG